MPRIKAEEKERKAREKESKRLGGKPGATPAASGSAPDPKKVRLRGPTGCGRAALARPVPLTRWPAAPCADRSGPQVAEEEKAAKAAEEKAAKEVRVRGR